MWGKLGSGSRATLLYSRCKALGVLAEVVVHVPTVREFLVVDVLVAVVVQVAVDVLVEIGITVKRWVYRYS